MEAELRDKFPKRLVIAAVVYRIVFSFKEDNRHLLLSGNLFRPEDIGHYDDLVDGIKLATVFIRFQRSSSVRTHAGGSVETYAH